MCSEIPRCGEDKEDEDLAVRSPPDCSFPTRFLLPRRGIGEVEERGRRLGFHRNDASSSNKLDISYIYVPLLNHRIYRIVRQLTRKQKRNALYNKFSQQTTNWVMKRSCYKRQHYPFCFLSCCHLSEYW
jgi:hypothetical protein